MVLAYATLAAVVMAMSDALIVVLRPIQEASPTVRMGRVGPRIGRRSGPAAPSC